MTSYLTFYNKTMSRELVQRYFAAFESGSLDSMRDFCASSFVYELLPQSMGVPPKSLEEYIAWIAGGLAAFKDGKLTVRVWQMRMADGCRLTCVVGDYRVLGNK